jgi:hypothetical protein
MCVMESILDNDVFESKCKFVSQATTLRARTDPNLMRMRHVDEISSKKRKLIQEPTEETRTVERQAKRIKSSTACPTSSLNGN